MTPRDIAALGAVRIREGRERRVTLKRIEFEDRRAERRRVYSPRAAELAAEIERLRGMLAALEENNARLRGVIHKATDVIVLASGIAAGECSDE